MSIQNEVCCLKYQLFDPLGLTLPVTIKGKLLVRELWLQKLGWDDPVPEFTLVAWRKH